MQTQQTSQIQEITKQMLNPTLSIEERKQLGEQLRALKELAKEQPFVQEPEIIIKNGTSPKHQVIEDAVIIEDEPAPNNETGLDLVNQMDATKFGLEKSKADQIQAVFVPMVATLKEFESRYNEIIVQKEITEELTLKAKRLRLDIAKVRTSAEKARKDEKEAYLKAGKAIDGIANILKFAVSEKEDKLEKIEKHFELLEEKRRAELESSRISTLIEFGIDGTQMKLGEMQDDVWSNYLAGTKLNHEAKKEAEKKAEEERLAKAKAEEEEKERIRLENENLKKEAEENRQKEKERQVLQQSRLNDMIKYNGFGQQVELSTLHSLEESAYNEILASKKELFDKAEKEKSEAEAIAKKEKEEAETKLKAEQAAKAKLEAELKAKKDAEEKAKLEKEALAEAELSKGDKEKFEDFMKDLEVLKTKYQFKSKKYKGLMTSSAELIEKIISFLKPKL